MSAYWTTPPDDFSGGTLPTYVNFRANPFQVMSQQSQLVTEGISQEVMNFFEQYAYKMHQEPDPNGGPGLVPVLELRFK